MAEYYGDRGMSYTERAVMLDAARGLTARQSAEKIGCTLDVIQDRRRKVKARLGARTLSHAVALTMAFGYIADQEILEGSQS